MVGTPQPHECAATASEDYDIALNVNVNAPDACDDARHDRKQVMNTLFRERACTTTTKTTKMMSFKAERLETSQGCGRQRWKLRLELRYLQVNFQL